MKKRMFLLLLLLIIPSVTTISAYTIPSTGWEYQIGNVTYTVNETMNFENLNYSDSWIQFNNTRFNVTSENDINVTLVYLSDTSVNGIELLNISVNTFSGNVTLNIGGLRANSRHRVDMNGTTLLSTTSNNSGWISFTNDIWSTKYFQVFRIIGLSCSFTYTVSGGLMTLTPAITGATHYQWTLTNETGIEGQTPWIPIGDINKYMQGYIYPTTIRVLLSAKNINFNQYANYSGNVKITKSSFDKPEPTEIIEEEPDLKLKNIYDTGISDWLEDRKPGEFLVIGSLILLVAIILFKKRPKKIVIYTIKKENIGRKVDKILEEKK